MLKKRLMATILVKDGIVVQSIGFKRYLPVGRPEIAVEFLNNWGIDEIILLDISAGLNGGVPDFELIKRIAIKCRVPLTVGGGVRELWHVRELISNGADKVSLNYAALYARSLISEISEIYGNQSIVGSIDVKYDNKKYSVYDYRLSSVLDVDPLNLALQLVEAGAGEICINSVDRDGKYSGFDVELGNIISNAISVPTIISGGAGKPIHFKEIFLKSSVEAASAANFFHFSEHSVSICKSQIMDEVVVRHESDAQYLGVEVDSRGRLLKRDEKYLEELMYVRYEKEKI